MRHAIGKWKKKGLADDEDDDDDGRFVEMGFHKLSRRELSWRDEVSQLDST